MQLFLHRRAVRVVEFDLDFGLEMSKNRFGGFQTFHNHRPHGGVGGELLHQQGAIEGNVRNSFGGIIELTLLTANSVGIHSRWWKMVKPWHWKGPQPPSGSIF